MFNDKKWIDDNLKVFFYLSLCQWTFICDKQFVVRVEKFMVFCIIVLSRISISWRTLPKKTYLCSIIFINKRWPPFIEWSFLFTKPLHGKEVQSQFHLWESVAPLPIPYLWESVPSWEEEFYIPFLQWVKHIGCMLYTAIFNTIH